MYFFYRAPYQSDTTRFVAELKAKDPALEAKQRHGRELLWDKAIDRRAQSEQREADVAQKPYVYQTDSQQA